MFQAQRLVFYYATSPLHMGAGQAVGAIDNPIQREVHTDHPLLAGSGIKGALRHHLQRAWAGEQAGLVLRLFGPDSANASDYAGALSFGDASIVAFPVRCARRAYVYATSPMALGRLKRQAAAAGVACGWAVPPVAAGQALLAGAAAASEHKRLLLEVFDFDARTDDSAARQVAEWLAGHALPAGPENDYFRKKLKDDLVVLTDADFGHFVRHATVVEPHVRIKDETGTADPGGLFYTENLPPESLLAGLAMASPERSTRGALDASAVLAQVFNAATGILHGQPLQFGGDASTGRGLVLVTAAEAA
jgi:CRISPR-associated protein Cmr4